MIQTVIPDIPTPPSSTDKANFRVRADSFLASLDDLAEKINSFASEANILSENVSDKEKHIEELEGIVIEAKIAAVNAKDIILSYAIPNEATYKISELDDRLAVMGNALWLNSLAINRLKIKGVV